MERWMRDALMIAVLAPAFAAIATATRFAWVRLRCPPIIVASSTGIHESTIAVREHAPGEQQLTMRAA
jgi:hypothetical protein